MVFYHRLFAAYYFIILKIKKISKSRIEEFQAVCLVILSHILMVIPMALVLRKFNIIIYTDPAKIFIIVALLLAFFFSERYFLGNRARRNSIIDSFRELNDSQKRNWKIIALAFIIVPIISAFFLK